MSHWSLDTPTPSDDREPDHEPPAKRSRVEKKETKLQGLRVSKYRDLPQVLEDKILSYLGSDCDKASQQGKKCQRTFWFADSSPDVAAERFSVKGDLSKATEQLQKAASEYNAAQWDDQNLPQLKLALDRAKLKVDRAKSKYESFSLSCARYCIDTDVESWLDNVIFQPDRERWVQFRHDRGEAFLDDLQQALPTFKIKAGNQFVFLSVGATNNPDTFRLGTYQPSIFGNRTVSFQLDRSTAIAWMSQVLRRAEFSVTMRLSGLSSERYSGVTVTDMSVPFALPRWKFSTFSLGNPEDPSYEVSFSLEFEVGAPTFGPLLESNFVAELQYLVI